MMNSEDWLDQDIRLMNLCSSEKAGLQIYRNYSKSFKEHAVKNFKEILNSETINLENFERFVNIIVKEDSRFLPVIVCSFADTILKDTFKRYLVQGIPGGKDRLFSGYGPLSDFSKRIQLAYAFNIFSSDLMLELDNLRSVRNAISHSWDIESLDGFLIQGKLASMYRMEELVLEIKDIAKEFSGNLNPVTAFRIRLVWIVGRLVYESAAYNRAKEANLDPFQVLYSKHVLNWFSKISIIAMDITRKIMINDS